MTYNVIGDKGRNWHFVSSTQPLMPWAGVRKNGRLPLNWKVMPVAT